MTTFVAGSLFVAKYSWAIPVVYYGIKSREDFLHALNLRKESCAYHPIVERIAAVQWDGTDCIPFFLRDILGAEDTPYTREVSRLIFHCGMARLMNPGCKVDYMPILTGKQGCGKSTAVRLLALEESWYGELPDIPGIIDRSSVRLLGVIPYDGGLQSSQEKAELAFAGDRRKKATPYEAAFFNIASRLRGKRVRLFEAHGALGGIDRGQLLRRVHAVVHGKAAFPGVERGQLGRAEAEDGDALGLQILQRQAEVQDALGPGADHHDRRLGELLQIRGDVHRGLRAPVDAADAAGGEDGDARHVGDHHGGGDGAGAV